MHHTQKRAGRLLPSMCETQGSVLQFRNNHTVAHNFSPSTEEVEAEIVSV